MLKGLLFSDIDEDLYDERWGLHKGGYAFRGKRPDRLAHRIVLARKLGRELKAGEVTDHINRNKLDNRRNNLRLADKSLNSVNRNKRPDNTTGFIGVCLYYPKQWKEKGWAKRWSYRIERKGQRTVYSKLYRSPKEAYLARQQRLKEYTY